MRSNLTKLLMLLALIGLPFSALGAQDAEKPAEGETKTADLPTVDELIAKVIEAEGGREAMAKITNRITRANVEMSMQGMRGSMETWQFGDEKFRVKTTFEGLGSYEQGMLDGVFWNMDTISGGRILEGAERELAMRQLHLHPVLHMKEDFPKIEIQGIETVRGIDCYEIEAVPTTGAPETWYFGVEDHLTHRRSTIVENPQLGKVKVVTDNHDYKVIDGLTLPHRLEVDQGMMKITLVISEYVHNTDMPDEIFALPPLIQKLVEMKGGEDEKKDGSDADAGAGEKKEDAGGGEKKEGTGGGSESAGG